jgi:hypothetical protein
MLSTEPCEEMLSQECSREGFSTVSICGGWGGWLDPVSGSNANILSSVGDIATGRQPVGLSRAALHPDGSLSQLPQATLPGGIESTAPPVSTAF